MGLGLKSNVVYVIDFGLSKPYHDNNGAHIPYRSNKNLTGTARYASINNHRGVEQSRRDDLESALYVLLYFLRGNLPWQGLPAQNRREKYKRILDVKTVTAPESLCKGFPHQLKNLVRYCKGLKFEETPNYKHIKDTLCEIAMENGFTFDNVFDWSADHNSKEEVKVAPNTLVKIEDGEKVSLQTQKNSKSAPKPPPKHTEYELVMKSRKKNSKKGSKEDSSCSIL